MHFQNEQSSGNGQTSNLAEMNFDDRDRTMKSKPNITLNILIINALGINLIIYTHEIIFMMIHVVRIPSLR